MGVPDHIDTDHIARTIRARQRVEEHYLAVERHTGTPSEGTPDEHSGRTAEENGSPQFAF